MSQGKVTGSSLRLRNAPNTDSDIIADLPTGTIVEILKTLKGGAYPFSGGTRDDWHEVKVNSQKGFVASAFVTTITSPSPTPSPSLKEIRAVWIVNHPNSSVLSSSNNIINALNFLQAKGFNTVFPAVWNRGFTAFPSEVMASHGFPKQDPFYAEKNFDPVKEIVEQGKQRGMAVIPWFEYGFAASADADGGHILQKKSQWAAIDNSGNKVRHGNLTWMNSLNEEVQQFMLDLILEVINKYDVDGIQGDDRLPAMPFTGGYDTETRNKFKAKFGKNPPNEGKDNIWVKFRADLLTKYLERLFKAVKQAKSNCIVSVSPAAFPFCLNNLMQDSDNWVEKDIVDFLHPQLYRESFDTRKSKYKTEVERIISRFPSAEKRAKFAPGIAFTVTDTTNNTNKINLTTSDIVQSVQFNRQSGLSGESFFFFEGLTKNSNQMAIALQKEANYDQIASLPPPFIV